MLFTLHRYRQPRRSWRRHQGLPGNIETRTVFRYAYLFCLCVCAYGCICVVFCHLITVTASIEPARQLRNPYDDCVCILVCSGVCLSVCAFFFLMKTLRQGSTVRVEVELRIVPVPEWKINGGVNFLHVFFKFSHFFFRCVFRLF